MEKIKSLLVLVFLLLLIHPLSAMDRGGESLEIDGGSKGNILFPHRVHQDVLGNCKVCHDFFAQKKGAIAESVTKGDLKKKQIMNKTCIQCHRDRKKAGQSFGPINCNDCHKK